MSRKMFFWRMLTILNLLLLLMTQPLEHQLQKLVVELGIALFELISLDNRQKKLCNFFYKLQIETVTETLIFHNFFFFWHEVTFYLFIFKNSFSFHHSTSSLPSYQPSYTQHTKSSYQKVIQNPRKYRRYFSSFEKKWLKKIWISFSLIRPSFFLNSTNSSQFGSRQTIPSLSSSCIPSLITLQQRFAILWLVGFLVYTLFWLVGCFILLCCDWLAAFICLIFYAQFFACKNHHIWHYIL